MGGKRYTHTDKERGFRFFFETGSIAEVTRRLKKTLPKISKTTVLKWSKEKDARGLDWYARRQEIQVAGAKELDKQIANDREEILQGANLFKARLLEQLPALDAKSLEGSAYAYNVISKLILEQTGADRNQEQTAKEAVNALILALKDDAEISTLLEKKWVEIETRFYDHLKRIQKNTLKKDKGNG